jgi:hypothetical protein
MYDIKHKIIHVATEWEWNHPLDSITQSYKSYLAAN